MRGALLHHSKMEGYMQRNRACKDAIALYDLDSSYCKRKMAIQDFFTCFFYFLMTLHIS